MFKKTMMLFLIVTLTNATTKAESYTLKHQPCQNEKTTLLSPQEIAQQQLAHLTTNAPFWTAPTKGLGYALIGASFIAGAAIPQSNPMLVAGGIIMLAGFTYTGISGFMNYSEIKLQQHLIASFDQEKTGKDALKEKK